MTKSFEEEIANGIVNHFTGLLLCEVASGPKQQGSHPTLHGMEEVQTFGRLDKLDNG
jgi:hypothetical protein